MMSNDEQSKKLIEERLKGLSEEDREVAIKILQQIATTGASSLLDDIKYADFDEVPVDIETFLHDRNYLGNGLIDPEGRFTVWPYWENTLKKIFPDNITTAFNTIVFTGAIGIGKSMVAVICVLYMLYRLLCLKDPYGYYGMQPIDKLSISFMNITIENAKGVALDKMNQLILASPWFMSHGQMAGTANLVFRPEKHIEFIAASSNNQIIGRAIFCNFSDEVNFSLVNNPERQKKKMMKIITQVDARMRSRFLRGTYLPTLNIIASSKDTDQSFLDEYIDNKVKNESKTTLIISEPQWVVDDRKNTKEKFWVAVGSEFLANELLPLNVKSEELAMMRDKGYDLWEVPMGYLETFQQNLDEAICSIIGISTASSLKYISGQKINQAKTDTYENPFVKDVIEVGNAPTDYMQYANFFDLDKVSDRDKACPLFIHLDMSYSDKGDKTGIAGVIITGREPNVRKLANDSIEKTGTSAAALETIATDNSSLDLHYKLLFSVSIKAPAGAQVSFAKNRNFIRWLRDKGFDIKGISSDTFQSGQIQQDLKSDDFHTEIISVDRVTKDATGRPVCLPYHYLKTAIYERHITLYEKCEQLTAELVGLERKADGHVDHTKQGINSKDQADAVCGALYLASKYAPEYSYNYGDQLAAVIDSNIDDKEEKKRQMIVDMQSMLTDIYKELDASEHSEEEKKIYQDYKDISDGIFTL